jgi:hypothetical protein
MGMAWKIAPVLTASDKTFVKQIEGRKFRSA